MKNLYAPVTAIKDIKEDMLEVIKREEFTQMDSRVKQMESNLNGLLNKDDVVNRLASFSNELAQKLKDRPTIGYLKQVLSAYD